MNKSEQLSRGLQREITDLANSITEMIESFKSIRQPLAESHDKVPQAANQLDRITRQTEAAAHQMLDLAETIVQRNDEVKKGLQEICEKAESESGSKLKARTETLVVSVDKNMDAAYTLMDSLQFQDITAQQMNHAASLLEDIEEKLRHILANIGGEAALADLTNFERRPERAYDPHADFVDRKADQDDIDDLFASEKKISQK